MAFIEPWGQLAWLVAAFATLPAKVMMSNEGMGILNATLDSSSGWRVGWEEGNITNAA